MPLLVDCYNVLHADMPVSLAGLDQAGLCRLLGRSSWSGQRIVVVCDGVPRADRLEPATGGSVNLVYSGSGRSADDVMIEMIDADSAPRRLTVVSSDRQIRKAARRRRCRVLSSVEFIRVLAALRGPGRALDDGLAVKQALSGGVLSNQEVQRWLRRFGIEPEPGSDDRRPPGR